MGQAAPAHKESIKTIDNFNGEFQNARMTHFEPSVSTAPQGGKTWRASPSMIGFAASVGIVAATVLMANFVRAVLPTQSFAVLFLLAVLVASVRFGFWNGIATSLLAFFAYNFFIVEPVYTLHVAKKQDVLELTLLLAASATTGFLAGRMREEAEAAKARATMLEQLASFTGDLEAAKAEDEIPPILIRHLAAIDNGEAVFLRQEGANLKLAIACPAGLSFGDADCRAAEVAIGRGTDNAAVLMQSAGNGFSFFDLGSGHGVIGYRRDQDASRFGDSQEQLRRTMLRHGQVALERARLAKEANEARSKAERESLRAALLASLSHDLKTPLATILGGVTSLRELGDALAPDARLDLLVAVEEETERLSRYVSNLLQMTRLNAGIDLRLDWIDVADVAHGAVERARRSFSARRILFVAPFACPLIRADAVLLEQALFNLIDNAVKFSGPETDVEVAVRSGEADIAITVSDSGPGIAPAEMARMFEPFFRGDNPSAGGIGLGLSISRGIVEALSGTLTAQSPLTTKGGTMMKIRLLLPEAAAA